jgi:hypothetical protein
MRRALAHTGSSSRPSQRIAPVTLGAVTVGSVPSARELTGAGAVRLPAAPERHHHGHRSREAHQSVPPERTGAGTSTSWPVAAATTASAESSIGSARLPSQSLAWSS